jgi:hypothetical protein
MGRESPQIVMVVSDFNHETPSVRLEKPGKQKISKLPLLRNTKAWEVLFH